MHQHRATIAATLVLLTLAGPAVAHKGHHPPPGRTSTTASATLNPGTVAPPVAPGSSSSAVVASAAPRDQPDGMMPMMHDDEDRSTMTFGERLLDWLGRLHVSIVHFPLALFPAALLAALLERRRIGFAGAARFLIIVGGLTAPLVAMLGWLDGGIVLSDSDRLLQVHRWLGTVIGLSGLGLAIGALKRPGAERGTAMLVALVAMTAALLVQGWYGGAMVHGIDHMNW